MICLYSTKERKKQTKTPELKLLYYPQHTKYKKYNCTELQNSHFNHT